MPKEFEMLTDEDMHQIDGGGLLGDIKSAANSYANMAKSVFKVYGDVAQVYYAWGSGIWEGLTD